MYKKKSTQRLRISVIIFCEIAERIESPGVSGNSTIHRSIATLSSRRVLYSFYEIFVTMRAVAPAILLSRCAISAINFLRHRCQLWRPCFSTYKPRARVFVDICNFFFRANENFSRFPLDSIGKEERHPLVDIIDYAILGRERKREPFFVTVPVDKLYFSNGIHFFLNGFAVISRTYFNNVIFLFFSLYVTFYDNDV